MTMDHEGQRSTPQERADQHSSGNNAQKSPVFPDGPYTPLGDDRVEQLLQQTPADQLAQYMQYMQQLDPQQLEHLIRIIGQSEGLSAPQQTLLKQSMEQIKQLNPEQLTQMAEMVKNTPFTQLKEQAKKTVYESQTAIPHWLLASQGDGLRELLSGETNPEIVQSVADLDRDLANLTREESPEQWAQKHSLRGTAYFLLTEGNRVENVQHAIASFTEALSVFTPEHLPARWASLVSARGLAYQTLTTGIRQENLTLALADYDAALPVLEREQMREQWSMIMMARSNLLLTLGLDESEKQMEETLDNLSTVDATATQQVTPQQEAFMALARSVTYMSRQKGDRAQHLEHAIPEIDLALAQFTWEQWPGQRAGALTMRGNALLERAQGDQQEQTRQAISDFTEVLDHLSRERQAENWAFNKSFRAHAYSKLFTLTGDRFHIPEQIMRDCDDALTVFTLQDKPELHANVLLTRSHAYIERVQGDLQQNLELALADTATALKVFTREQQPYEWALTHANIGNTYLAYIRYQIGNARQYARKAVEHYEHALQVLTREQHPVLWAQIISNQSQVYQILETSDTQLFHEQRLDEYKAALSAINREENPVEWAIINMNFGNAYLLRTKENRHKNIEQAWHYYNEALQGLSPEKNPMLWAQIIANRGMARRHLLPAYLYTLALSGGGFAEAFSDGLAVIPGLLEDEQRASTEAIADFDSALTILTQENAPREWATVHRERAITYALHLLGNRKENLQKALADYEDALKVITREIAPLDWALIHYNRGLIYLAHVIESPQIDALHALADFDAALEIYTPEVMPANHRRTQITRSMMLERLERWEEAHAALLQARKVQRDLVAAALSESSRADMIADVAFTEMYIRDVQVLLRYQTPDLEEVAIALEEGRAQNMRVALDLDTITPARIQDSAARKRAELFLNARNMWRAKQHQMLDPLSATLSPPEISERQRQRIAELQTAYHAFLQAREAIRQYDDPDFMTPVPTLESIAQCITGRGEALIYLAVGSYLSLGADSDMLKLTDGSESGLAVVITRDVNWQPQVQHMLLSQLTSTAISFLIASAESGMPINLEQAIHSMGAWGLNDLALMLHREGIRKVTFVTYGRLSLFPLPAVQIRTPNGETKCMGDLFEITFAPGARAAAIAQQRVVEAATDKSRQLLLLAGNPKPLSKQFRDLPFAEAEADTLRHIAKTHGGYPSSQICRLRPEEVTKERVVEVLGKAKNAHLAVHGIYNADAPRRSRLIFAGRDAIPEEERTITLGEALEGRMNLQGLRLLTLSACETSTIDLQNANEVIGLAAGFLQAGAAGVIASLWKVDDRATYLLMTRFAQLYLDSQNTWSPARALTEAQRWLRTEATNSLLANYDPLRHIPINETETVMRGYTSGVSRIREKATLDARTSPDALPYADPRYWAAFIVTGY